MQYDSATCSGSCSEQTLETDRPILVSLTETLNGLMIEVSSDSFAVCNFS